MAANQLALVRHEECRLEVIENDRVVAEQLGRALREIILQLFLIFDVEPLEDRLVVPIPIVVVAPEALEQRVAAFAPTTEKHELGLALGDAD